MPGVRDAEPEVSGTAVIVGRNGKAVGTVGPPQLGLTWFENPDLNPYRIASGRAPRTADEVVIDQRSAEAGKLRVGQRMTVLTPDPTEVTLSGIATFGKAESAGGLTAAIFTLDGAQAHLGAAGRLDAIRVAADPGVSQEELAQRIDRVLPDGVEAVTGKQAIDESQDIGRSLVGFLRPVLLTFALIALLVGSFSIYNTFNIVVAQRTRESALLRAIGASRRQTLLAVFGEAAIIGVFASALGVAVGRRARRRPERADVVGPEPAEQRPGHLGGLAARGRCRGRRRHPRLGDRARPEGVTGEADGRAAGRVARPGRGVEGPGRHRHRPAGAGRRHDRLRLGR